MKKKFYELSPDYRQQWVKKTEKDLCQYLQDNNIDQITRLFEDKDFYKRRNVYLILGRLYRDNPGFRDNILILVKQFIKSDNQDIKQTVVYLCGEIGKVNFHKVEKYLDSSLQDKNKIIQKAVIGAVKQLSEHNPQPTLEFAKKYLHHDDPEIRREIIHGIELRGRTHPHEILPLLKEIQNEQNKRVRDTLVHVIGQISYKAGCLETVLNDIRKWRNKELIKDAIREILIVHKKNKNYNENSYQEALKIIRKKFPKLYGENR